MTGFFPNLRLIIARVSTIGGENMNQAFNPVEMIVSLIDVFPLWWRGRVVNRTNSALLKSQIARTVKNVRTSAPQLLCGKAKIGKKWQIEGRALT
ncbi:hypothetical protein AC629_38240 [Bradyrhizobium sp. NAS80.1]|uniref:hypothetical protein n=1 Tax=Bradyrhizobium sp. NAS80.1 TaxID=1680159 RepID=UPI00095A6C9D|nr:hypothetical protein [Bradyrhizobium sp. NAS80.1]OKO72309.1 hypothetical protein AC629_38240 [Bradyrhizobium sp. NAS80.1]